MEEANPTIKVGTLLNIISDSYYDDSEDQGVFKVLKDFHPEQEAKEYLESLPRVERPTAWDNPTPYSERQEQEVQDYLDSHPTIDGLVKALFGKGILEAIEYTVWNLASLYKGDATPSIYPLIYGGE